MPLKPLLVAPGKVVFVEGGSDPIPPGLKFLICSGTPVSFFPLKIKKKLQAPDPD